MTREEKRINRRYSNRGYKKRKRKHY